MASPEIRRRQIGGAMTEYLWPESRCFEALEALAVESGVIQSAGSPQRPTNIPAAAAALDLEAQPVAIPYSRLDREIAKLGPALAKAGNGYLAICRNGTILTPDRQKHRLKPAAIRAILCADRESAVAAPISDLLQHAQIPASKQAKARDAILRERLSTTLVRDI